MHKRSIERPDRDNNNILNRMLCVQTRDNESLLIVSWEVLPVFAEKPLRVIRALNSAPYLHRPNTNQLNDLKRRISHDRLSLLDSVRLFRWPKLKLPFTHWVEMLILR